MAVSREGADSRPMDVSVIIPTYNRRETLRRTLLLYNHQQGMTGRFEIIVVDDSSTDATPAMLAELRPQLEYPLRWLSLQQNSGQSAARNRALEVAQGHVLVITGDDIFPGQYPRQ